MAYEGKKLVDKLKSKGLDIAEEAAQLVLDATAEWLQESAVESENKIDDVVVPAIIAYGKPAVDQQVDKIDGKIG